MSSFTGIVNSLSTKPTEPNRQDKLNTVVKGQFIWNLPTRLNLPANAKWAVRLQFVNISNKVANIYNENSYSMWFSSSSYNKGKTENLNIFGFTSYISSVMNLVKLLNGLLPQELVRRKIIYFSYGPVGDANPTVTLTVTDGEVILGVS